MNLKTRFTTAIATGAVLVNALAPVAFANTITVSGNGAFSNNAVNVTNSSNTVVNQTNSANIVNKVDSNASTGGNSSSFNTGGSSTINTGSATNKIDVSSAANLNKASLSNCGSCDSATNVTISGNGAYSDNGANVNNQSAVFLNQDNKANIKNYIDADSSTGYNDSKFNTGGDSIIVTGDANTKVNVSNKANANIAEIGGGNGESASILIEGNGAFSDNAVALSRNSAIVLDQDNWANIKNDVDADADTGYNDSKFNTGGFSGISTGDAETKVAVDNAVNFNAAALDCECVVDGLAVKVAENGADSENVVEAAADNAVFNDQLNAANLWNDVEDDAKSGKNDIGFSTGGDNDENVVYTGAANSATHVSNSGNVNILDNGDSLHLPGDWEVGTTFDLSGLLVLLHGWIA